MLGVGCGGNSVELCFVLGSIRGAAGVRGEREERDRCRENLVASKAWKDGVVMKERMVKKKIFRKHRRVVFPSVVAEAFTHGYHIDR